MLCGSGSWISFFCAPPLASLTGRRSFTGADDVFDLADLVGLAEFILFFSVSRSSRGATLAGPACVCEASMEKNATASENAKAREYSSRLTIQRQSNNRFKTMTRISNTLLCLALGAAFALAGCENSGSSASHTGSNTTAASTSAAGGVGTGPVGSGTGAVGGGYGHGTSGVGGGGTTTLGGSSGPH